MKDVISATYRDARWALCELVQLLKHIDRMGIVDSEIKESLVVCMSCQRVELRAPLLRLTRFVAVFEIYGSETVLHLSEVLSDFKVLNRGRPVYAGRATVSAILNIGTSQVCEAKLDESAFNLAAFSLVPDGGQIEGGFRDFLHQWEKTYTVLPEFKVVIADMQTFLTDLRLWMGQLELNIRSTNSAPREEVEQAMARELAESIVPAFDAMHERLESISESIAKEHRAVHQSFAKRQLHPLVLCSPFAHRTYFKPLGYAGDYRMVDMLLQEPFQGDSLFAKVVNSWFVSQWPAKAHRNRIAYLKERLLEEGLRGLRRGKPIRTLNLGCGPAREIQELLIEHAASDLLQIELNDFNQETLDYALDALERTKREHGRQTSIQVQRKSVHQVLREGGRSLTDGKANRYDFIYCAGLLDYLSDRTCKQLMSIFYDLLNPGGLLVATNVDDCKPFRHMLEFVLDWHLIYRDSNKTKALIPDHAPASTRRILRDPTTVNVFIEVRKPGNA
ncbi:MAG: methyltransferase domain-containing protein [Verrucomicrobia bacterium]|nr:methyltransferase domain-containing protein [Verrucomicrobiota bacterium]